jgi:hypothetical protein
MQINGSRATTILLSQMDSKDLELLCMMCHAATSFPNDYNVDEGLMQRMHTFYNLVAHELELRDLQS